MREQGSETRLADAIAAGHDHRSGPGIQRIPAREREPPSASPHDHTIRAAFQPPRLFSGQLEDDQKDRNGPQSHEIVVVLLLQAEVEAIRTPMGRGRGLQLEVDGDSVRQARPDGGVDAVDVRVGPSLYGVPRRGSERSHEGVGQLRFSLVVGENGVGHGSVVPRWWTNRRAIRYTDREAIVRSDRVRRPQMTDAHTSYAI